MIDRLVNLCVAMPTCNIVLWVSVYVMNQRLLDLAALKLYGEVCTLIRLCNYCD